VRCICRGLSLYSVFENWSRTILCQNKPLADNTFNFLKYNEISLRAALQNRSPTTSLKIDFCANITLFKLVFVQFPQLPIPYLIKDSAKDLYTVI
jgi:hypothetical protein